MLVDSFGRKITYLRISVTDRCNLRCVYCMPEEGIPWQSHEKIMRFEEIFQFVKVAAENGITRIRITGGEPLVRKGVPNLIKMLSGIDGIDDISLTTNGILLGGLAEELAKAGLNRVNISLDTLDRDKYRRITRVGQLDDVWRGILATEKAGLDPIKINMVVLRGVNDDEVIEMARLTLDHPWIVRFIEFMQFENPSGLNQIIPEDNHPYFSILEMKELLEPLGLHPTSEGVGAGPSSGYKLDNAKGSIGFIAPYGDHFCKNCNRLRLTADGNLRPCLLNNLEVPVLPAIRSGEPILPYLQQAIKLKPEGHQKGITSIISARCMTQIGG